MMRSGTLLTRNLATEVREAGWGGGGERTPHNMHLVRNSVRAGGPRCLRHRASTKTQTRTWHGTQKPQSCHMILVARMCRADWPPSRPRASRWRLWPSGQQPRGPWPRHRRPRNARTDARASVAQSASRCTARALTRTGPHMTSQAARPTARRTRRRSSPCTPVALAHHVDPLGQ